MNTDRRRIDRQLLAAHSRNDTISDHRQNLVDALLRIVNDGAAYALPPPEKRGFGLSIMQYRARLIGAEVTVGAGKRGGCEVVCVLEAE